MARTTTHTSRRFALERLEHRSLMAADLSLSGGVLSVQGTDDNDEILLQRYSVTDRTRVMLSWIRARVTDADSGEILAEKAYLASAVDEVLVQCFGGNDTARNNANKPSTMYGGAGADNLHGEDGNDTIYFEFGDGLVGNSLSDDWNAWLLFIQPWCPRVSDGPYAGCGVFYG